MADLEAIAKKLSEGRHAEVKALVQAAVDENVAPETILNDGLIAGMAVVGEKFKKYEVGVPQVLFAARAMNAAMEVLEPVLVKAGIEPIGKVAVGTVQGDEHDIGKNIVAMMLKGNGFTVVDLGKNVPTAKFVAAAEQGCTLIGMSALLTTTMPQMKDVIESLKKAGKDGVRTMVGGAPVTKEFAEKIGADGYADDASSAVDVAKSLVQQG